MDAPVKLMPRRDPYRILVSAVLSTRTQDPVTAAASARLFRLAPDPRALARMNPARIRKLIFPVGFYRTKAKLLHDELVSAAPGGGAGQEEQIRGQIQTLLSPWFVYFLSYDPATALEKVRCPVLALGGDLDLQVFAADNIPAIAAALKKGGNKDVTTRILPGLNHLFQHAKTGSPSEYGQIEETFAPEALTIIGDWVTSKVVH